jgi:hypothetical protein
VTLTDWLDDGLVKRQASSRAEIQQILAVADRDLADANVAQVSLDRRFAAAYGAALQLATIVLRASGYRTSSGSGGHHWRTIALLPELMGPGQTERAAYLDSCRRARNTADYDRVQVISKGELVELLEDTLPFRRDVLEWLGKEHREFV